MTEENVKSSKSCVGIAKLGTGDNRKYVTVKKNIFGISVSLEYFSSSVETVTHPFCVHFIIQHPHILVPLLMLIMWGMQIREVLL